MFNGELDCEFSIGSIYKYEDDCFVIESEWGSFTFPNGGEDEDFDENDCTIEEVVSGLLSLVKVGVCESIDFRKDIVNQINQFGKENKIEITECITNLGNSYK